MAVDSRFQVRPMSRDEVPFAIDLAAREGWNPGRHDAACFFAADPGGFLIGELAGEPVGCISAVSYGGRFGFIGLYIVRPEHRGRGFGRELWRAAMTRLHGQNVGLDGVVAQQPNYARSGFRLAYRNVRYRGSAAPAGISPHIARASAVAFAKIAGYDRRVFPEPREAFLRTWLTQPDAGAFVALDEDRVAGYAVVRPCREGWKIGPLAADGLAIAQSLYDAASSHATRDEPLFLDIPEPNRTARELVALRNLQPVFETARMYTGPDPEIDLSRLFGVTTFELG